jgi:DNA-binding NarL/FixJ family response regulator
VTVLRVLIADDHPVFRQGLRAVLAGADGMEVVGETASGEDAVAAAAELQPDVVAMDLHMPGLNGVEATRRIMADSPHVAVLVVTMLEDDDSVFAAMRAGARGYLLKDADQTQIIDAIRSLSRGEVVFGPTIADRVLIYFASPLLLKPVVPFPELTEREREVLHLIAQGLSNYAIAGRLFLSGKTVRNHISNIFSKLQLADRAEAIVRAREAGLGSELPRLY